MTELSALHVKITGDSGGLNAAVATAKTQLSSLGSSVSSAQARTSSFGGAFSRMGGAINGARGQIQNTAFQLQDMAVQLQMGTRASVVFAQQGPQILGAFGPVGAMLGALAAISIPALAFAFGDMSSESADLTAQTERLKEALEGLTQATAALTLARQMLASGAILEDEQIALNEINRLTEKRAEIEGRLSQMMAVSGNARGAAQRQEAEAARDALNAELAVIDAKLKALQYERDLATATKRRANEARNAYREEAAAQAAVKAGVERVKAAFDNVTSAAQSAARAAASIGTAAQSAIGGVQQLATAMWNAAQAKAAFINGLPGAGTRMLDDERGSQRGTVAGSRTVMPDQPWMDAGAPGGGGGGGGDMASSLQSEIEAMQQALLTQEQLQAESFARQQELLSQALAQRLITQEEYQNLMQQAQATHDFAMTQSVNKGVTSTLNALGSLFQGSKKISAAIAVANSWLAFTEVLKDPAFVGRPWARVAAAGQALAAGLNAVRNIKSAAPGGGGGGGGGAGGGASAPQQNVQTLNFTVQNDSFGIGQNLIRQIAAQLNEAQRNGSTLIRATVA